MLIPFNGILYNVEVYISSTGSISLQNAKGVESSCIVHKHNLWILSGFSDFEM